jgi:hypothetical protein
MSRDPSNPKVVPLPTRSLNEESPSFATCVGELVGWTDEQGPIVNYPDNPHPPLPAISAVALDGDTARELAEAGQRVILAFDRGRSDRPILMALVHEPTSTPEACVDADADADADPPDEPLRVSVDGENVTLTGKRTIELRCGKASIVLTKAGKVIIRGTHLVSSSSGANRIRGGSVELN